jgi:MFS family permease
MALLLSGQLVSATGDWFYSIAASVAVYQFSGHKSFYVGLLWVARLVPGLFLDPISGRLADRWGYRRAMLVADLSRVVIIGVLAFTLTGRTWVSLYPLAFLNSAMAGLFRPASVGFIPTLLRSKEERLSANASVMQVESLGGIVGSALGGIIAASGHVQIALLIDSFSFAVSAASIWLIRPSPATEETEDETEEDEQPEEMGEGFLAGLRYLASRPVLVFVASVLILPEFASGALLIWFVPYGETALHLGDAGVGYLYSVLTVGALLGGFVASALGSSIRLDRLLAMGVVGLGIATIVFGTVHVAVVALACCAAFGIVETVQYAAYDTLLQQAVPEDAIGRATGTMDALFFAVVLIGNAASGLLASTLGLTVSIAGLGILILAVATASWLVLRARTAGQPEAALLARIPAFASVPDDVREWAVRRMAPEKVPSGAVIIRQGEEGDRFYTIARGKVEVSLSQDGQVMRRELGPGDFFGEIALLQNVPRTATVTALEAVKLWTMTREDFRELQHRASEFKESLWEAASARLQESTDWKLTLAARP